MHRKFCVQTSRFWLVVLSSLLMFPAGGCSQYKPAGPTEAAEKSPAPPQSAPEQPAE
jgi:hypothetical protein